jgi:hypothetical protein
MRSGEEQEDFLEHGRFGEGAESITRAKVDRLVWIGLLLLLAGGALLGSIAVFKIGRDDGGRFFVLRCIVASAVGVVLCIWGLARTRTH